MRRATISVQTTTADSNVPAGWPRMAVWSFWAVVAGPVFVQALIGFPRYAVDRLPRLAEHTAFDRLFGLPAGTDAFLHLSTQAGLLVISLFFSTLIFWRRPSNVAAVVTSLCILTFFPSEMPFRHILTRPGDNWVPIWAAVILWQQALALMFGLALFFLFPDGRFVPGWTRWALVAFILQVLAWLAIPSLPFNVVDGYGLDLRNPLTFVNLIYIMSWFMLGLVAIVVRYRGSADAGQRQQMKWFTLALGIAVVSGFLRYGLPALAAEWYKQDVTGAIYLAGSRPIYWIVLALVPITCTIAIFRYRLWDIDPLLRRVLVWGLGTVFLVASYVVSVSFLQFLLRSMTLQDSNISVVLATLLSAALILPLYRRLQALVDRYFDRQRVALGPALVALGRDLRIIIRADELHRYLVDRTSALLLCTHSTIYLAEPDGRFTHGAEAGMVPNNAPALDQEALAALAAGQTQIGAEGAPHALLLPLRAPRAGQTELIGLLALGARRSGQPYRALEREELAILADQAGTALAVAQLVEVEREYERSRQLPPGQAEALASRLLDQPAGAIITIAELADQAATDPAAALRLGLLPEFLRSRGARELAEVAEAYHKLHESMTAPDLLIIGLRQLVDGLVVMAEPTAQARLPAYRLALAALSAADSAAIIALPVSPVVRPVADEITGHPEVAHPANGAGTSDRLATPEPATDVRHRFGEVLHALTSVTTALAQAHQADRPDDRAIALDQARLRLGSWRQTVVSSLGPVDRSIAVALSTRWQELVTDSLRRLRDQAHLELRLITRRVVTAERLTLVFELVNSGRGPASQVRLELVTGPGYRTDSAAIEPPPIEPGQRRRVEVVVEPDGTATLQPHLELRYHDGIETSLARLSAPVVTVLVVPSYQGHLASPYVTGPPLSRGSPVFVGRSDDLDFIAEVLPGSFGSIPLLLTGQRRMGKTTLLRQLPDRLRDNYRTVHLDIQGLAVDGGIASFFYDIASEIAAQLELEESPPERFATNPTAVFTHEFLPKALAAVTPRRLLLLFDEMEELELRVTAGKLEREIFAYLRHLMHHHDKIALIFVGTHRPSELKPQYWAHFFNAALHRRLGCLDAAAARQLIVGPLDGRLVYDDLAIDRVLQLTGRHPYFIQLYCHTLVRAARRECRTHVILEHIDAVLDEVLEQAEAHLVDMLNSLTMVERAALAALLARPADSAGTEGLGADALGQRAATPEAAEIGAAALRLVDREILQLDSDIWDDRLEHYDWQCELFAIWFARRGLRPRS